MTTIAFAGMDERWIQSTELCRIVTSFMHAFSEIQRPAVLPESCPTFLVALSSSHLFFFFLRLFFWPKWVLSYHWWLESCRPPKGLLRLGLTLPGAPTAAPSVSETWTDKRVFHLSLYYRIRNTHGLNHLHCTLFLTNFTQISTNSGLWP